MDETEPPPRDLSEYLAYARAHADTSDTRQHIQDLEDMLRVAWNLMTPDQHHAFTSHADILALEDAAGGTPAA